MQLATKKATGDITSSVGAAIGHSVIVTGESNFEVVGGNLVGRNVDITNETNVISDEQALERISAAVRLNLNQLGLNMEQARAESSQFFRWTLLFAGVGFVIIMVGIILLFMSQITAGIVSVIAGLIPELTALLFFAKDRELRQVITAYNQNVLDSQQILTMVDVAETIDDPAGRDRIKQQIIVKVLGISTP